MSVLIKGMDMPERCWDCDLCYDCFYCRLLEVRFIDREDFEPGERRLSDCPLVLVSPHGALIDREELLVEINKICDRRDAGIITDLTCVQQILSALRHAPTIIPAEEGE